MRGTYKFSESSGPVEEGSSSMATHTHSVVIHNDNVKDIWDPEGIAFSDGEEADCEKIECRICQDEDSIKRMEAPCGCNGSLKFAHRKCIQRWCNEKKNTLCEICHQPYRAGYTVPPLVPRSEDTALDIRDGLNIPGSPREVHSPRVLAAAASEEEDLLEAEHNECAPVRGARTAIIRSTVLILMAILITRRAISIVDEEDNELYNLFSVFSVRILAFLTPLYIMAWIATVLFRRSQRHEADGLESSGNLNPSSYLQSNADGVCSFTIASTSEDSTQESEVLFASTVGLKTANSQ